MDDQTGKDMHHNDPATLTRVLSLTPLLLLSLWVCPATALSVFSDGFTADFNLRTGNTIIGRTQWRLQSDGDHRFFYETVSKAAGIFTLIRNDKIVERSEWLISDATPRPLRYRYERTGGKRDRNVEVDFDWDNGIVRTTAKGQTWRMNVPAHTLDKLGYLLVLMKDLSSGKRKVDYLVADGGKLKTYNLEVIGEETIDTSLGALQTLKVKRFRDSGNRETIMWCAPALNYLPVRVEHTEKDGTVLLLNIETVQGIGGFAASGN